MVPNLFTATRIRTCRWMDPFAFKPRFNKSLPAPCWDQRPGTAMRWECTCIWLTCTVPVPSPSRSPQSTTSPRVNVRVAVADKNYHKNLEIDQVINFTAFFHTVLSTVTTSIWLCIIFNFWEESTDSVLICEGSKAKVKRVGGTTIEVKNLMSARQPIQLNLRPLSPNYGTLHNTEQQIFSYQCWHSDRKLDLCTQKKQTVFSLFLPVKLSVVIDILSCQHHCLKMFTIFQTITFWIWMWNVCPMFLILTHLHRHSSVGFYLRLLHHQTVRLSVDEVWVDRLKCWNVGGLPLHIGSVWFFIYKDDNMEGCGWNWSFWSKGKHKETKRFVNEPCTNCKQGFQPGSKELHVHKLKWSDFYNFGN